MNCHHARQLISPYLDQQLTGRQMLALQEHFGLCTACEGEMRSIRQVKLLLRGLHDPRPRQDLSEAIALRLAASEVGPQGWRVLSLPFLTLPAVRPQRGRRLVTAMALSCLTVLSFAAPFAPAARDGAQTTSGFLPSVFFAPSEPMHSGSTLAAGPTLTSGSSLPEIALVGQTPPRMTLAGDMDYIAMTPGDVTNNAAGEMPRSGFFVPAGAMPTCRDRFFSLPQPPADMAAQTHERSSVYTQRLTGRR